MRALMMVLGIVAVGCADAPIYGVEACDMACGGEDCTAEVVPIDRCDIVCPWPEDALCSSPALDVCLALVYAPGVDCEALQAILQRPECSEACR